MLESKAIILSSTIHQTNKRMSLFVITAVFLLGAGIFARGKAEEHNSSLNYSVKAPDCDIAAVFGNIAESCGPTGINCMCSRIQNDYAACQSSGSLEYQTALNSANKCCSQDQLMCLPDLLNFLAVIKSVIDTTDTSPNPTATVVQQDPTNQLSSTTLVIIAACIFLVSTAVGFAIYFFRGNNLESPEPRYKSTSPEVATDDSTTTFDKEPGHESISRSQVGPVSSTQPNRNLTLVYQAPIQEQNPSIQEIQDQIQN
jgi:hypothetical protein